MAEVSISPPDSMWSCTACTMFNHVSISSCDVCGYERVSDSKCNNNSHNIDDKIEVIDDSSEEEDSFQTKKGKELYHKYVHRVGPRQLICKICCKLLSTDLIMEAHMCVLHGDLSEVELESISSGFREEDKYIQSILNGAAKRRESTSAVGSNNRATSSSMGVIRSQQQPHQGSNKKKKNLKEGVIVDNRSDDSDNEDTHLVKRQRSKRKAALDGERLRREVSVARYIYLKKEI
jgi:hypothetical protein